MTTKMNKKICIDFLNEVHNNDNLNAIDTYLDKNVFSHDPFPGQAPGSEGVKDTMRKFREAFPDKKILIHDVIAEGDKVMVKFAAQGTHLGEFSGIPASGNTINYEEVVILRVKEEKIVEHWAVADALTLMQQVGAIRL
ncbi:conserved hypothetical protein, steroid delta-isomerase-related [Seinonella peptonophila]|uniref:SnoaL-like polyketide cyclase n=1 Tax=Seinonella peptonophila TaxID=112248 RepID=A0A1M5B8I4_9BACL|nr:ester cyclase [Seinonella peptonophila]SHF38716.1 conserved hypothetical protein, steroid delta-isomerase-related [Seinonella peptonophila]